MAQVRSGELKVVGGFQVGADRGIHGALSEALGEFLWLMPDAEEVHDECQRAAVVGFLHLKGEAHEGFGEFVEGLRAPAGGCPRTGTPGAV